MYSKILFFSLLICVTHSYLTSEIKLSNGDKILGVWVPIRRIPNYVEEVYNRIGGIHGEEQMCKSRAVTIKPLENVEKDAVWQYFFNDGLSSVEGEECLNPGGSCTYDLPGTTTKCVQKYTNRVLVSLEGTQIDANFKIPSGCVCVYKKW